jgi:hypothetical protein
MRCCRWSATSVSMLALAVMGCNQSSNDVTQPSASHASAAQSIPQGNLVQVVLQVPGMS